MKKGIFITFEGLDCSGKTTQINLLKKSLEERGYDTLITREPGGTSIGEKIRDILLDKNNSEMVSKTELMLYLAARSQFISEIIIPEIKNGKIVISDRFIDSTTAYQGFGRKIDTEKIRMMNDFAINSVYPDITFFIDTPLEVCVDRLKERKNADRIEDENEKFFKNVREGYLYEARNDKDRIKVINGNRYEKDIFIEIIEHMKKILQP